MTIDPQQTPEPLLPMGRLHAIALALFGPPDTAGHPFTGTKYDPRLKQIRDEARRHARLAARAQPSGSAAATQ